MTLKTEVKEKVGTVTFFEATANSLSPLAISAVTTPPEPENPPATAPKAPKGKAPGFEVAGAIAALCALYLLCRKIRR